MTTGLVKARHSGLENGELMQSPITVLNGVSEQAAAVLGELQITNVIDLAMSPIFMVALALSFPDETAPALETFGVVPSQFVDPHHLTGLDRDEWRRIPVGRIRGVSDGRAADLYRTTGVETVLDLAVWPPFIAAQELAGNRIPLEPDLLDPGVPPELVPRFNDHASEKSFYSVYVIDAPADTGRLDSLKGGVSLADLATQRVRSAPRTGHILRYEQAWIPTALTMGNLLHSLALAPGESTRIAMIDWSRRQGVSTTEDISQLESLANTMMQTRSVNEITRAVAREAQAGFSSINANSTVSNNAYSTYGLQNGMEVLAASGAGATAGGLLGLKAGSAVGAGIGLGAGAAIGTGIGVAAGGAGSTIGLPLGAIIGTAAGSVAGAGAGGLIGATGGGVGAGLAAAQFGADSANASDTTLDSVTTTSSTGTRDLAAEMAQTINDRSQQHASSSRNRRASIVQEVSESESEKITTRVVTNYNHMHALTIQYFEVVQAYTVRTTLVGKQPCLYIPIEPVDSWTPELVRIFSADLIRNALSAEIAYSLSVAPATVALTSPRYSTFPVTELAADAPENLADARASLDRFVSADPYDGWIIPDDLRLVEVWPTANNGGGPLAAAYKNSNYKVWLHTVDGDKIEYKGWTVDYDDAVPVKRIAAISYAINEPIDAESSLTDLVTEAHYGRMRLSFSDGADRYARFKTHFSFGPADIDGRTLTIPLVVTSRSLAMSKVIEHLDANTDHYSGLLLNRRNNPLVRRLLASHKYEGKPLLSLVDQEPVAVSGNDLIFVLRDEAQVERDEFAVGKIVESEIVPVATGGVFAEAIQGRANSAELLDIGRFWNWQDSPIPILPPDIAPIQAGSRSLGPNLVPGRLDGSVIGPMTPAALPAPAGVGAILNALTADLFRDMSGVEHTAQAANTALEEAMAGAVGTGAQTTESLQKGLTMTKDLVGKIVEMNSDFAGKIVDAGVSAMNVGGAVATGGGGLGLGGATGARGGGSSGTTPSTGGAILNEAIKQNKKRNAAPTKPPGGGSNRSGTISGGTPSGGSARVSGGDSGPDFVDQAMGWLMGVPDKAGSFLGQLSNLSDLLPDFDLGKLMSWWTSQEDPADSSAGLPNWKPDLDPAQYRGPGQASQAPALEIYEELMANAALRHVVNSSTEASGTLPGPDKTRPVYERWYNHGVAPLLVYARHNDAYVNSAIRQYVRWKESIHLISNPDLIDEFQSSVDAQALIGHGIKNAIDEAHSRMEANNDLGYLEDVVRWAGKAKQVGLADDQRFDLTEIVGSGPLRVKLAPPAIPAELGIDETVEAHISGGLAIGVNPPLESAVVAVAIEVTNGSADPAAGQVHPRANMSTNVRRTSTEEMQIRVKGEASLLDGFPVRGEVTVSVAAL